MRYAFLIVLAIASCLIFNLALGNALFSVALDSKTKADAILVFGLAAFALIFTVNFAIEEA
jgi:hypothetical protein